MDDSILIQLNIIVERAVRPIRAAMPPKLKMREEMLTHVVAAYQEEFTKSQDEKVALENTARRLGEPGELTRQLQASIPKPDWGLLAEHIAGFPEGESVARRAARHFGLLILMTLAYFPILVFQGRMREWPIFVGMPITACLFTFLSHGLRQALFLSPKRRWHIAIPVLIVSAVALPAATFAMCLTISCSLLTSWNMVAPLISYTAVLTPIVVVICAWGSSIDLRKVRDWERLAIAN